MKKIRVSRVSASIGTKPNWCNISPTTIQVNIPERIPYHEVAVDLPSFKVNQINKKLSNVRIIPVIPLSQMIQELKLLQS